jgi:NAD+ synthase
VAEARPAGVLRPALVDWIRARVAASGQSGAVFGLSGGVDSAVTCGLAAEALGSDRCLALILPIESPEADTRLAAEVADHFGVRCLPIDLERPFLGLVETLAEYRESAGRIGRAVGSAPVPRSATVNPDTADPAATARANLKPRLRALTLYYFANLLGYLVLGTSNRDERAVGYFTKWGDGAADLLPLGDLLKAEVRDLARALGVPAEVIERPPSAGLWPGQTDEDDLGVTYGELDAFLLTGSSGAPDVDERIRTRADAARHKLESPAIAHIQP